LPPMWSSWFVGVDQVDEIAALEFRRYRLTESEGDRLRPGGIDDHQTLGRSQGENRVVPRIAVDHGHSWTDPEHVEAEFVGRGVRVNGQGRDGGDAEKEQFRFHKERIELRFEPS